MAVARENIAASAERTLYRIAGLPIALRGLLNAHDDPLRSIFTTRYWHPRSFDELSELAAGIFLGPLVLVLMSAWYLLKNGKVIRERYGRSVAAQLYDQLRLYFSDGVVAPWYYIFELHKGGSRRARTFIQRFETKTCYFPLLKRRKGTPLNDKQRFAEFCAARALRCVETALVLRGTPPAGGLPDCDIFVKKVVGRGGTGAERWDRVADATFANPAGMELSNDQLLSRLVKRSQRTPLMVQNRLTAHPDLPGITSGALPTIRVLTCLDENCEPEVVAAMLRTSFGASVTVDNLHAGGIGALVDLQAASLSRASNLGSNSQLGWFSAHPDTGAEIEGRIVPHWPETKCLAVAAHHHFTDRVIIGWDIAILHDGPILIEGNGNPDLDILQRFMLTGFREHRFGQLLRHHLRSPEKRSPSMVMA